MRAHGILRKEGVLLYRAREETGQESVSGRIQRSKKTAWKKERQSRIRKRRE